MFIETSSRNSGVEIVLVSFGRTDINQLSNFSFRYNRFSSLNNNYSEAMEWYRVQFLLSDDKWSARKTITKTIRMPDHQHNGLWSV